MKIPNPFRRAPKITLALFAFALVLVLALAWAAGDLAAPDPSGVFLTEGGLGYIVLRAEGDGLKIVEPAWTIDHDALPDSYVSTAKRLGRNVRIEFEMSKRWRTHYGSGADLYVGFMDLAPSQRTRGDFDLVGYRGADSRWSDETSEIPPPILNVSSPSYLHRVDDERVPLYFQAQRGGAGPARAFELASALLAAHPDDLRVRALFLEAALKKRDFALFTDRLGAWRAAFLADGDPYLQRIPALGDYVLNSKRMADANINAGGAGTDGNLDAWMKEAAWLNTCAGYAYFPDELNPERMDPRQNRGSNWIDIQVFCKVTAMQATFWLFQGRREEALDVFAGGFYYGAWSAHAPGVMINRLVGLAIEMVELNRLSLFALNASETEEELRAVAKVLERVEDGPSASPIVGSELFESPPAQVGGWRFSESDAAKVRFLMASARHQVLRGVVAARRKFLRDGAYPSANAHFSPWLPDGLPHDPFCEEGLGYFADDDGFVLYSVGPDGVDDHAAVAYDPTNGARSGGDVFTRIPIEREFPFPRAGLKAATPEDLARQFPRGLPIDFFAVTRNRPLSVAPGPPVSIYSFGPDNTERFRPDAPEPPRPEIIYDPTNGLTSNGDLFVTLPAR